MIDFKDFIAFLINPNLEKEIEIKSITSFLKLVWLSFLYIFVIGIIFTLLISIPLKHFNLLPPQKQINLDSSNILKISLLVPIIEELVFRLPLRVSKISIAFFLSATLFMFLFKLNFYIALAISISIFLSLILSIKKDSQILIKTDIFFAKYFYGLFYFQALVFGLLHLTNYNLDYKYFYLFPCFILIYIFTGCLLGYVRVRYTSGIYVCIATHIVLNSLYCLLHFT
jgi:hypothetical protein